MTELILRPPEEKDLEALTELCFYMWNDFYKDYVPKAFAEKKYTRDLCRQYQREMLEAIRFPDKAYALVAIDQETGDLAALCYINQNDEIENNDLYIPGFELELQHLYIWPQYRHKNLGGKLFQAILKWARQHDYYSVYWWVLDLNPYSYVHVKRGKVIKQMARDYTGAMLNVTAYGMEL